MNPISDKKRKVVLVTGASRGIGRACVRELANEGWSIKATARSEADLASLASDCEDYSWFAQDLSHEEGRSKLKDWLEGKALDGIVHCLGGKPSNLEGNVWQDYLNLNFLSLVFINEALLPNLKANGEGSIIHVSSAASSHGYAFTPYACAKSALNRYIINEGRRLLKEGITISGIMPAAVKGDDNRWEKAKKEDTTRYQEVMKKQVIGRLQTTEEIAKAIVWLCSPSAKIFGGCVLNADPSA